MKQALSLSFAQSKIFYELFIDRDILNTISRQIFQKWGARFAIITDENVERLYGQMLHRKLQDISLDAHLFSFPAGEEYKNRQTKQDLEERMFAAGLGRETCILAVGGGVVTDMAGFVASTYCRGVPVIFFPTSLLGMVDASVGGKTGIDSAWGKNLIGTLYHPKAIYMDLNTLTTLPLSEMKNGVVEMIKHGLIADKSYVNFLSEYALDLLNLDQNTLEKAIFESCLIKKNIVEQDEKESGKRRVINFGHTIGHALEKLSHYRLTHGEAVARGIMAESYLSMQMGFLDRSSFERIKEIFSSYQINLNLNFSLDTPLLLETLALDKKSIKNKPRFVILKEIGLPVDFNGSFCTTVDDDLLNETIEWMRHVMCRH